MRVLRPGGHVLINSGNIRNPRARRNEWILDETVWVVGEIAEGLVRTDPAYAAYLPALDDTERMAAHAAFRDKVFLHPRPLDFYLETLELAGLKVESVREASIEARVGEWYEFLTTYSDAVLGWVGGTEKIDGATGSRCGRRPVGADAPRHGRAVPRPPDVPGLLDIHHVRQWQLIPMGSTHQHVAPHIWARFVPSEGCEAVLWRLVPAQRAQVARRTDGTPSGASSIVRMPPRERIRGRGSRCWTATAVTAHALNRTSSARGGSAASAEELGIRP